VERWVLRGNEADWLSLALLAIGIITLSAAFSVLGAVVIFHGFQLSRRGEDLFRSYGLLTRRASSLPRRRIQTLKIEENWLRRWLGWVTIRADTAGSRAPEAEQTRGGRDVLLPLARRTELDALLGVFFPEPERMPAEWQRVHRCAIRRQTLRIGIVLFALAVLNLVLRRQWMAVWPLLLLPFAHGLARLDYRHLGYALGARLFWTRRGWLNRSTQIVPVRNIQSVTLRRSPWDRRYRVRRLLVDTAGQAYTGGGPHLSNLSDSVAWELARELAGRAGRTRYRQ
jgi:putative membrane protein